MKPRLLLALIFAGGLVLRMWGVGFGLPGKYRPDEEYIVSHALGALNGELNPHFFIYPAFYFYLAAALLWVRVQLLPGDPSTLIAGLMEDGASPAHLLIRQLSAVLGAVTIWLVFHLGRLIEPGKDGAERDRIGLLAALFLALNYVHTRDSHFAVTDAAATCLATATLVCVGRFVARAPGAALLSRWLIAAAVCAGLAAGTKYPAAVLSLPLALAIGLFARGRVLRASGALIGAGAVMVAVFAVTNPYLFIERQQVADDFAYQANWVREGLPGLRMEYGASWLFGFALRYGAGLGVCALAALAAMQTIARVRRPGGSELRLCLLVFLVAACLPLLRSKLLFFRYVMILMPAICVFAAAGLRALVVPLRSPGIQRAFATVLVVAVLLDPAIRIVRTNVILTRPDTRNEARAWIDNHVPPGEAIGSHSHYFYGKPQLSPGYSYRHVAPGACRANADACPAWYVIDQHPIEMFSWPLSPADEQVLRERYDLLFEADPFRRPEGGRGLYDPSDAFYVPIAGSGGVLRPGTYLRIFRKKHAAG